MKLGVGASPADTIVALDRLVELAVEYPFEVAADLALHPIDPAEGKHPLADDAGGFVRVGIVADDFRGDHEHI